MPSNWPKYLELALRSPSCRSFIEGNATGASSSMKNITQDTIRGIPIALPPLDEQRRLAAILKDQMAAVERARAAAEAQVDALRAFRSALLRAAYSGRL
ncbi:MAG: restriction endonuclease subunit S [Planctomycetota bacterium]|nr:restriction endonuclease subunit S [Planctomycetota bacterium]